MRENLPYYFIFLEKRFIVVVVGGLALIEGVVKAKY